MRSYCSKTESKHIAYCWLICVAVLVVALVVVLVPNTTEPRTRLVGLCLQLLGLGTVIFGIAKTKALFGTPTIRMVLKDSIHRIFKKPQTHVLETAPMELGLGLKSQIFGTVTLDSSASQAELVAALQRSFDLVHERISDMQTDMGKRELQMLSKLEQARRENSEASTTISSQLEAFATGGVDVSLVGALWMCVGLVLSTAGVELAKALSS